MWFVPRLISRLTGLLLHLGETFAEALSELIIARGHALVKAFSTERAEVPVCSTTASTFPSIVSGCSFRFRRGKTRRCDRPAFRLRIPPPPLTSRGDVVFCQHREERCLSAPARRKRGRRGANRKREGNRMRKVSAFVDLPSR